MEKQRTVFIILLVLFTPIVMVSQTPHASDPGPVNGWLVPQPNRVLDQTSGRDVSIVTEPYNPPITIPASGGNFDYTITATNGNATPEAFNIWTMVTLPGGHLYGPLFGPVDFLVPPLWSTVRENISQIVPGYAPPGIYTYHAHVGVYPDQILDSDSFTLEKLAESAGWYPQTPNTGYSLNGISFPNADFGWAVSDYQEIIHTTDGGNTWFPQDDGEYYPHQYNDVMFLDEQTGWVVGHGYGLGGTVLHTTDGGANWAEQSYSGEQLYGVSFVDADNGWVVGGFIDEFGGTYIRVIAHTTDGGVTWSNQLYQYYYYPLYDIQLLNSNEGWAVGGTGAILHTTDGGDTWLEQSSGTSEDLYSVSFIDATTGWCVGHYGTILHTTDGGNSWLDQGIGTFDGYRAVQFVDQYTGWIAGYTFDPTHALILHSTDGGNTWYSQDTGAENDDFALYDLEFIDADLGWAVGGDLFPFNGVVLHTESGGE